MNIWKNTGTLDALVPALSSVSEPSLAELAVIGGKPIKLAELPKLKGVFKCGIGRDNVPEEECRRRGIRVCYPGEATREIIFEETANFTVHLILRMLYSSIGSLEPWKKEARSFLDKRTVLLIGQGNIGVKVKRKLEALVRVETFDIVSNSPEELQGLMEIADVASLHIPLSEETRNFIDKERLSWLSDGAALVNTARGPIVDEHALLEEVKHGRLNAAFDVFWKEPYEGALKEYHPERFLMSPHVASTCSEFLEELAMDLESFVRSFDQ
jgi:phosphoglycerate dehydrogenase-like enzyme